MRYPTAIRIALVAAVATAVSSRSGAAQQAGFASLTGSVIDSIHGVVPLSGATIRVGNTTRQATTDANGRFQIDSIPPGEHSLMLVHPLLDTLSIAIATRATSIFKTE